jgi:uncharacterized damage-inducible protein DinB
MNYQTISDMVASAEKVRAKLKSTVEALTPDEANALPEGEKWTVAQVVEHVSMVDEGGGKICSRLLSRSKADGKPSDGTARISPGFIEKATASAQAKLEAPDIVQPNAGRTIAESLAVLDRNVDAFAELLPVFESIDDTGHKFPHPYFGDMTATEWFAVKIAHEARHTRQIIALVEKIRSFETTDKHG